MHFFQISVPGRPGAKPGWKITLLKKKSCFLIFSSAYVYTTELLSWRRRQSIIRLSSVSSGFSKTAAWIQTIFFMGNCLQVHFFLLFKILNFQIFTIFFSFSLPWDPMGAKISKCYSSHKSLPNFLKLLPNFCLQYSHKVTFSDF